MLYSSRLPKRRPLAVLIRISNDNESLDFLLTIPSKIFFASFP
jgi:hypothetical protein